jgi:hypothetical protein
MEPKLITINDLIKSSWNLYRTNIKKFILPIAITLPPYIILYALNFFYFPSRDIINIFIFALTIFINLWISILFIELIDKLIKKQEVNINELFQSSMKKIASYFWVSILAGLVSMLGFLLLIVPGIIFVVWYSFAEYIVVLEDKDNKGIKALKSSKNLVKERWGAAFWRLMIPALLIYITGMLIALVLTLVFGLGKIDVTNIDQSLLFNIMTSLVFLVLAPLFTCYSVILYHSLKETKKPIIQ